MRKKTIRKRGLLFIMCAAVATSSMVGCGKQDPKAELSKVMEQASKAGDIDMTSSMNIHMENKGEKFDMPMEIAVKTKDSKNDKLTMEMAVDMEINGQKMQMQTYYAEGYYYMDVSGSKLKYAMDIEEIKKQLESSTNYRELAADMFQDVSMEEKGDTKVFAFKGNLDKMSAYLEKSLTSFENAMSQDLTYEFSDIEGTITADENGEMKEMTMNFGMDLSAQGEKVSAIVDMTSKILATDEGVKLNLPDFKEYQEIKVPAAQ